MRHRQQAYQGQGRGRVYHAPHFVPAAAANDRARRRQSQQSSGSRSGGGKSLGSTLFGGIKLPNLIPQSMRGSNDREEDMSDAPMPYDQAELRQQQRPSRSAASGQQRSSASRSIAPSRQQQMRSAQSAAPSRSMQAPTRSVQTPSAQAAPRVARSSPTPSTRKNELAEALSGLSPSQGGHSGAARVPAEVLEESEITPPSVDEEETLPSYVAESPAVSTPRSVTRPRPSVRSEAPPRDLADALLGEDMVTPQAEAADEAEVAEATPEADGELAESEPAIEREDLVAPPMPSTSMDTPSSRSVTSKATPSKQDAAAAFRARPTASKPTAPKRGLGEIVAEKANSAFEAEAPSDAAPTAQIESKGSPKSSNSVRPGRGVLFTASQPIITSNIAGPPQIVVGRQAEYRVTVENRGDVAARDVIAVIAAPEGAELVDASASNGTVERSAADATGVAAEIRWQLYELPAGATQTLTLQLIPRGGREMQLGVQLTHAPTVGQAIVEIQEPKLQMEITGPADVMFGKAQRYTLMLNNPGNGAAEDVAIELTPPGGDKASMVRHKIGTIAPGESKKLELELTAREAGELKIHASALAANNLRADADKTVLCRKAELEVDWRGPDKKYAGAVATYYFRVRNPGTAAAEQVAVKLNLPSGAEMVEASDEYEWDPDRRVLLWKAAGLNAGEERFMEVHCRMTQPGINKMDLSAQTASGDLSDADSVAVTVEALADLKLEVSDPKGVIPVGDIATYEVRIKNRGMTTAKAVNIVAMFSEGIDPSHVEGGQHAIRDGRVSFRAIDLAAGAETVLKIHAKASQAGTHIFRAEVACEELESKLAAEETTRFFTEDERWADASTAYAEEASGTTTR
jgi:uncharacterized repeat protein (TIGR01451 family)